jgi:hypothetical protein
MRRPQFSLKFLFFLTTVVAAVVAIWLGQIQRVGRQRRFVAVIEPLGGEVWYSYQVDADGDGIPSAVPPGPAWLRRWVGDDYFASIYGVSVPAITDTQLAVFDDLNNLRELDIYSHGLTDKGVRRLAWFKRLTRLTVRGNFSASGLEALAALKDLRHLRVRDNNFTQSEKDRLARLMPECEIQYEPILPWQSNFQVNRNHYPEQAWQRFRFLAGNATPGFDFNNGPP